MDYKDELSAIGDVSFRSISYIARKYMMSLPDMERERIFKSMNRGADLLYSDAQLKCYVFSYGRMHQEKINMALSDVDSSIFATKKIDIIDWGCGQGLATMCFFDYLHNQGIEPNVGKVILIEPSGPAIARAHLHLSKYLDEGKIALVNKYIDDVKENDIAVSYGLVVHFFSNILDIPTIDIKRLAGLIRSGIFCEQLFFCVGPMNEGVVRLPQFASELNVEKDDWIKKYCGQLPQTGTAAIFVFKDKSRIPEFFSTLEWALNAEKATCFRMSKRPKTSNNPEGKGFIFEFGHIQGYCSDATAEMLRDASVGAEAYTILKVETSKGKLFVLRGNRKTFATRKLITLSGNNDIDCMGIIRNIIWRK